MRSISQIRGGRSRQFTTFDPAGRTKTVTLQPGERRTLAISETPGIVSRLWLTFPGWFWRHWEPAEKTDPSTLKKLILRIFWDGMDDPSVEAPVGDFFGIGHAEYRHYMSKYLGMSSGGFYSYFPMPYEKIRIELENGHESIPIHLFLNANYEEVDRLPEGSGRFHCLFRTGRLNGTDPLPLVDIVGRGRFAGCCVSVQGQDFNNLSYLEAPEYIFIDTEDNERPTIVGTGMEDYFNGGWYFREGEFHGELHGVPIKDPLRSMVSMYRFHEQDAIFFERSFRFAFVNPWDAGRLKPYWFASTAFWYQDRASSLPDKLPPFDKLMNMYRTRDADHQAIP